MNQALATAKYPKSIMLGSVCLVIAVLYFAQDVLIPLALAGLLSFLLAPLVKWLEYLRFPRAVAVVVTVLATFGLLVGVGWIVFNQIGDLKADMGSYHDRIVGKVQNIQKLHVFTWVHSAGDEMKKVLNTSATQPTKAQTAADSNVAPIGYSEPSGSSPLSWLKPIYSFLLGPVGTAFIVTVFTVFMLVQREDVRDRLIRLVGRNRLTTTTKALDDAAERVSRYLLMQSIVNGSVGVLILCCLWMVGKINHVPFPAVALWGLMAALLRFIPYIGIWVSAVIPFLLSVAVYPGAKAAFETLGVYFCVELSVANAVEPLLFGSSTGIATLAVLVAAAFWTWLWGPMGLLLSTPLTVCLVVMGKYVPQLEFLTILLSEEPALAPPDRVYQRLLASDQEEAENLVAEYVKKMPLEEVYDAVLTPALATAEIDAQRGKLSDDQLIAIQKGIRQIVVEQRGIERATAAKSAAELEQKLGPEATIAAASAPASAHTTNDAAYTQLPKGCSLNVACLPANDESDEITALMLAHLLEMRGYCVKVASVSQLASEMVDLVGEFKADVVCVSALPPAAVTHARYLCKRLYAQNAEVDLVVGLWATDTDLKRAMDRIACTRAVRMAGKFLEAIEQIHQLAQGKILNASDQAVTKPTTPLLPLHA